CLVPTNDAVCVLKTNLQTSPNCPVKMDLPIWRNSPSKQFWIDDGRAFGRSSATQIRTLPLNKATSSVFSLVHSSNGFGLSDHSVKLNSLLMCRLISTLGASSVGLSMDAL
ncbi:hypothetical protein CSKR_100017, partial [Clonorchis sinensis]